MKRELVRISILQSSKVITILYAILGLIYVPFGLVMLVFVEGEMRVMGIIYLFMPIVMAIFGFIAFVISAAAYNFLARLVGGIEVEVRWADEPATAPPE